MFRYHKQITCDNGQRLVCPRCQESFLFVRQKGEQKMSETLSSVLASERGVEPPMNGSKPFAFPLGYSEIFVFPFILSFPFINCI